MGDKPIEHPRTAQVLLDENRELICHGQFPFGAGERLIETAVLTTF